MDDEYVVEVCLLGKGAECCRYLMRSPDGWECAKVSGMKDVIDARASRMRAQGDNCAGWGENLDE